MDEIFDIYFNKNQNFNEEILSIYKKINEECNCDQELAVLHVIEAYSHIHSGRLYEAILSADKILSDENFDPQLIYSTRNIYHAIYIKLEELVKNDLTNKEIGPVFDALLLRGYIGLSAQVAVVSHFDAIGMSERANEIREKIRSLFPNYLENL